MKRYLTVNVEDPETGEALTLHLDRLSDNEGIWQIWSEIYGEDPVLLRDGIKGRAQAMSTFSGTMQWALFQRFTRED